VKKILTCLKNNEIVCLITDENKRRGGVNVDFFGKETATASGPAVFSLRTGAPIIPVFMVRQQDNNHKIIIDPPLEFTLTGNHNKDVHHITSRCTEYIESYVKAYPTQWFWLNRRWKGLSRGDKHAQGYSQK
jgi:KDO2-lipid IV(A) lauroyltransferase